MSEIEKRLEKLEAHDEIKSCLIRYCRALDWVDEDLLKTCFVEDGYIDYGFYAGDAKGFIPVVMEVERNGHSWHFLGTVAIELNGDTAEVESYGLTVGGDVDNGHLPNVNVYCGRYHDEFTKTSEGWKISRRLYILDANFPASSGDVNEALQGLFSGIDLRTNNDKYRKLY